MQYNIQAMSINGKKDIEFSERDKAVMMKGDIGQG